MCAGFGLYKLQRGADGIRSGICSSAKKRVGHAHLDQHGAEVIAFFQVVGAFLGRHFTLAQLHHLCHHFVKAVIAVGVDYLKSVNVEAAFFRGSFHIGSAAHQHGCQETGPFQSGGSFKYAGVGALGENYLPGVFLQYVDKILKHLYSLHKLLDFQCKNPCFSNVYTLTPPRIFFKDFAVFSIYKKLRARYNYTL